MRSDQFTNIAQYLCSEMGLGLIRTRISHDNLVPFRSNLKKPKNPPPGGQGRGQFFFYQNFIIVFKEPMQKFETLRQPLLWF